ncbi:cell division protein FtsZ [Mariniphaga anaerophila]|uniref:Cell division protein FtsZ n=1 Tax=Mariniphaga anaerophila TaxID=1484053 RepID=A0A1M5A982_9BACT|nr:cell division protein FtsZ [Mariniphaga anaerophila]SHF26829.1 cell division protein FtsZ [Mariniphaga anaerophila]
MEKMANFSFPEKNASAAIKVIGVGGGGGNALNHMFKQGIRDVDFVICNTDSQALEASPVPTKVQLGSSLTEGRGAGNRPEVGKDAALENIEDVKEALSCNTKMVFVTAGMGGGTGTGGAPVIAEACHTLGFLTVGIVTIPFRNEGKRRIKQALEGIMELENHVDALLVINNERIREMYGDFGISEAFSKADNVLATAAKGIAEIITVPGYINVDFADVETVMRKSGLALMGTGISSGEDRATKAVEQALNSPLLNNNDIRGAKNILLNITSGTKEVTMDEVGKITDFLQNRAGFEADLIWGNGRDEELDEEISVTLIATGFGKSSIAEITGESKMEKETHRLDVDAPLKEKSKSPEIVTEKEETKTDQKAFSFSGSDENSEDDLEFEVLYPKTIKERKSGDNTKMDFSSASDEDLDELENIPAYKRRQLRMNDPKYKKKLSNFSVDSENKLTDKNSYLHGQVD